MVSPFRNQGTPITVPWWTMSKETVFQGVWQTFGILKTRQSVQTTDYLTALRLYGDSLGMSYTAPDGQTRVFTAANRGPTLNLIKSVSETINAQIARTSPRPVFLTDGGNRGLQRKAKQLTRFIEGLMDTENFKLKAARAQLDSVLFGTGALKFVIDNDRVCVENVFPGELFVDPAEAIYKDPQTLYQRKFVHKDVLAGIYPEKRSQIMMAAAPIRDFIGYYSPADLANMVEVVEAWKLPTEEDEGRHVISISSTQLLDEPYTRDEFPFVFLRWTEQRLGFWGRGVPTDLMNIQLEINKIVRRIQKGFQILGTPWILLEQSSKVAPAQMSNEIGAIIPYTGVPPTVKTHQHVDPQTLQMLDYYWQKGYELTGVSPYLSSGNKPAGLTSGVGIREAVEVQGGRFALHIRNFEKMHLDAARWMVKLCKELAEENPSFSINAPPRAGKYTIERLKWRDVQMDDSVYTMKVYASSALPQEPSGRLATVLDLMNAGLVGPEEGRKLLDFPDLDRSAQLDLAGSDAIDMVLEKIVDDGVPLTPEPFFDLQLALKKAQTLYLRSIATGDVPQSHLRLLRNFIEAATVMQNAAMAAQQQEQAAMYPGAGATQPLPPGPNGQAPTALTPGQGQGPTQ
jgi:hypothetical protein